MLINGLDPKPTQLVISLVIARRSIHPRMIHGFSDDDFGWTKYESYKGMPHRQIRCSERHMRSKLALAEPTPSTHDTRACSKPMTPQDEFVPSLSPLDLRVCAFVSDNHHECHPSKIIYLHTTSPRYLRFESFHAQQLPTLLSRIRPTRRCGSIPPAISHQRASPRSHRVRFVTEPPMSSPPTQR